MSNANQQRLSQLPDLGEADQYLQQQVIGRAFMNKLAEYGIVIKTAEELAELYDLSSQQLQKVAEAYPDATILDLASALTMEKSASAEEAQGRLEKIAEEANIYADNIDVYRSVMALTLANQYAG